MDGKRKQQKGLGWNCPFDPSIGLERNQCSLTPFVRHVIFATRAYQVAPRHLQFIEENRENWEVVRIFDSNVAGAED